MADDGQVSKGRDIDVDDGEMDSLFAESDLDEQMTNGCRTCLQVRTQTTQQLPGPLEQRRFRLTCDDGLSQKIYRFIYLTTSIQELSFRLRNYIYMTFLPLFEEMILGGFSHLMCDNAGCLFVYMKNKSKVVVRFFFKLFILLFHLVPTSSTLHTHSTMTTPTLPPHSPH